MASSLFNKYSSAAGRSSDHLYLFRYDVASMGQSSDQSPPSPMIYFMAFTPVLNMNNGAPAFHGRRKGKTLMELVVKSRNESAFVLVI